MFDITFTVIVVAVVRIFLQVSVSGQLPIDSLMNLQRTSTPLTEVISQTPAMVNNYRHFQLHFIYDEQYRDDIHSFTNFPAGLRGTLMTTYDMAPEALGWILTPVDGGAIVVLLCQVDRALYIFRLMKDKKLEDTTTFWIVVLTSSVDEDWFHLGLEEMLLEGTNVVFLFITSLGNYKISASRANVDGVTRFNQIIQTLNTSIDTGSPGRLNSSIDYFPDNQILYSDMKGRILKVTASHVLLYAHLGPVNEDGTIEEHSGLEFTVLETLSDKLNFRFVVVENIDGSWGNLHPDGTATGMIGMVYRKEVDLALPLISITRSRSKAVDYTTPYLFEPKGILSRAPGVKASPFIIFSPFTSTVWISIISVTVTIGIVLQFFAKTSHILIKQKPLESFQSTIFNTYRSIVNQGELPQYDTPWTQRTTFYSWYLFCIIVLAHYSGTLISMLAIPSREKPIDSLTDLPRAVRDGFTIGTTRDTFIAYVFRDAKEGIYRDTWLLFNHDDISQSLVENDEGFDKVSYEKFVYIEVKSVLEAEAIIRGREKYHVARESYYGTWVAFPIAKGTPFKGNFDRLILRMVEGGLIRKWMTDEHRKLKKAKVTAESTGPMPMKMKYLQAAFYVLLIGNILATTVFIIEKIVFINSEKN